MLRYSFDVPVSGLSVWVCAFKLFLDRCVYPKFLGDQVDEEEVDKEDDKKQCRL